MTQKLSLFQKVLYKKLNQVVQIIAYNSFTGVYTCKSLITKDNPASLINNTFELTIGDIIPLKA